MKYYKKIEVDAFQYGIDEEPEWFKNPKKFKVRKVDGACKISQCGFGYCGISSIKHGEFIIMDNNGRVRSLPESIFKANFQYE